MIYRFGEFELDDALLELRFRGHAQLVPLRVMRATVHLLQHRTRAVSRDELAEIVWGGLAVSDAALSQTIMLARKLTHDEGDQQNVIKTVRGHGFRFVAPVTEVEQRVERSVAAPLPPDELHEPFFGREREIARLVTRLEAAEHGRGSLVLVQGAPGIGKTSLAKALCTRAIARGAQVFWGRSWEDGGAPAFWPFIQVLRAIHAQYGGEIVRSWLDDRCHELLALVPELAPPAAAVREPDLDPAQAQFRMFDAMSRVLRRMAHALHREGKQSLAAPAVVIALDDLHAADDATIHFLRFLSSDLRDAPLLIVGMFRDLEVTHPCALAALLGGPLEHTHRLALSGLEPHGVAQLAQRLLGYELAARSATQLYELSSGNPFLACELARFSQGEVELSALAILRVPERIAKAVRRRLEGLPDATRALLELAAVLGPEFPIAHLHAASGGSNDDLLHDLDPALRSGTLEPVSGSAGARLRFVHALVRDTLYGELPLARRLSMHRAVAEALEAAYSAGALPLYELAHHYYLAAPSGFALKAVDYARKAATHAEQVSAFDTAANLRDRALELAPFSHDSWVARWEMLLEAGGAWFSAGELDRASEHYCGAAEHARDHRDADRFALAVMQCIRVRRGFMLFHPRLIRLVSEALEMQGAGDSVHKALLLGFRGITVHSIGGVAERDAATREAVDMARRLDDERAVMLALLFRRWLMMALHPSHTREIASEVVTVAQRTNHHAGLLEGLSWRMQDHLALGEVTLAERDLTEYTELAERRHNVLHRYWAACFHAARSAWSGDFATATELTDAVLVWGQRIHEPFAAAMHALQMWNLCVLSGKPYELSESMMAVLATDGSFTGRVARLGILVAGAPEDTARRLYEVLVQDDFAEVASNPFRLSVLALLSSSCARFDDRARAQRLYELLLPDAALHVFPTSSWIYLGPVAESLAQLAICLRDYPLAAKHFERARQACRKIGARPQLARIQYHYAKTLQATPGASPELAGELLRRATKAADELGRSRHWLLPRALCVDHEDEN